MADERIPDRRVALIRGINVGRAKRVAMAELRALVEDLGYEDVRTVLNSGNVVFSVPPSIRDDIGAGIEKALSTRTGVTARVTVLTADELDAIIHANPLLDVADNPSRLLVAVLMDPADRERLVPLMEQDWSPEVLALGERVAWMWCPDGISAGRVVEAMERAVRGAVTSRNWSTMSKLQSLTR